MIASKYKCLMCCSVLRATLFFSFPRRAKKWALRLNEYILLFQCPKEFLCCPLLIILCHISLWTITYINRILVFFLFIWYSALILGYTSINIRVFAFFPFFFWSCKAPCRRGCSCKNWDCWDWGLWQQQLWPNPDKNIDISRAETKTSAS